jgi:glycosyltransferase involved in cell wall biosynthesis
MLYSEGRKFVFVAVPKTGTTSIQDRLQEVDPDLMRNKVHDAQGALVTVPTHATALEIRKIMGPRAQEFTFVAFLRDPCDVLVSKYHFYRSGREAREHGLFPTARPENRGFHLGRTLRVLSAQILPLSLWARVYPFPSSSSYITDEAGHLIVEQIGTTEHLQQDALRIFGAFGYTPEELHLDMANRSDYARVPDPRIKAITLRRLPGDCALFDRLRAGQVEGRRLNVAHFARRPAPGAFSLERVFHDIRAGMPHRIDVVERRNAHLSQGIRPRLADAWNARHAVRTVNHVLGDVHYLTYFLPRRRTILTVCDTVLVEREKGIRRFILWFFWFWLPVRRCAWITTISEESRRRLIDLVSVDPDRVVAIPVTLAPEFTPQPPGPRGGPFRLLHIGTKPNKNLERLVPALDGLDVELTVIGQLSDRQKALIETHLPRHRLLCNLDDAALRAEYARAELLVFVSLDEGFGLPIIEAQATGRPVLTSDRAPMNEVAGECAVLVDPKDAAAIRDGVRRLVADTALRESLVERGFANAERFSARSVAAQYAALYEVVARENGDV